MSAVSRCFDLSCPIAADWDIQVTQRANLPNDPEARYISMKYSTYLSLRRLDGNVEQLGAERISTMLYLNDEYGSF